jgi:ankyrin repeat protein
MSHKSNGGSDSGSEFSASEKSNVRHDEDDDEDDLDLNHNNSALGKLNHFVKRQGKAFVKNFVDYGPPYTNKPFDVALLNECAKPILNHMELHKLLNTKLNPNLPDPEDLYYTPIHWCARNAHFMGLKMLFRAGAKVNLTNEMGNSALELAVMMKHPPDRRGAQVNCVKFLLEKNADVNNRDKGGYSAIDHAAVNQDLELIKILLEAGAKVMRENYIFVGTRHHILSRVHNPECYKVLYEKLIQEENEAFSHQIKQQQRNFVIDEDNKHVQLHKALSKKKERRLERQKLLADTKREEDILQGRLSKLRDEMEKNLQVQATMKAECGIWTKDYAGHWDFHPKKLVTVSSQEIYQSNRETMKSLRDRNSIDKYNKLWFHLTNKGNLELPWRKADPFTLPDDAKPSSAATKNTASLKSLEKLSNDVEYRDENDDELTGEDLNDMMSSLQGL